MKKFGRRKVAPEGWNEIEPTIKEFERKLREGKTFEKLFKLTVFSVS